MCECYQIGGRFIAEDPDCPVHGIVAIQQQEEQQHELEMLHAEIAAWRERFPQYKYRRQDDCIALK